MAVGFVAVFVVIAGGCAGVVVVFGVGVGAEIV